MPFRDFLARIRKIIPLVGADEHYKSIAADLESGALRQPVQPMSDAELGRAIAEFRKSAPSNVSREILGSSFNPKRK